MYTKGSGTWPDKKRQEQKMRDNIIKETFLSRRVNTITMGP